MLEEELADKLAQDEAQDEEFLGEDEEGQK